MKNTIATNWVEEISIEVIARSCSLISIEYKQCIDPTRICRFKKKAFSAF